MKPENREKPNQYFSSQTVSKEAKSRNWALSAKQATLLRYKKNQWKSLELIGQQ